MLRNRRILVVDDEPAVRKTLRERLRQEGAIVEVAGDAAAASIRFAAESYDLLVVDQRLPDDTGIRLIETCLRNGYAGEFVLLISPPAAREAVAAMRLGAAAVVSKPFDPEEVVLVAGRALERSRLREAMDCHRIGKTGTQAEQGPPAIVGASPWSERIRAEIGKASVSGVRSVVVRGEPGTEKELIASVIHASSARAERACVRVDVSLGAEPRLEGELFGHESGAAGTRSSAARGLLDRAGGGTLVIDVGSDVTPEFQAKLLRLLESRRYRPLGGIRDVEADAMVIALIDRGREESSRPMATRDPWERVAELTIDVAPLRERREDVMPIAEGFCRAFAAELKKRVASFTAEARVWLCDHAWAGNWRELRNCVERAVLLTAAETVGIRELSRDANGGSRQEVVTDRGDPAAGRILDLPGGGLKFEALQRDLLEQALLRTRGNKTKAASLLGIHRDQVRYWVKKFSLADFDRSRPGRPTPATDGTRGDPPPRLPPDAP